MPAKFGLHRGDGVALLKVMLDLAEDPQTDLWMSKAPGHLVSGLAKERAPATVGGNPLR